MPTSFPLKPEVAPIEPVLELSATDPAETAPSTGASFTLVIPNATVLEDKLPAISVAMTLKL